MMGAESPALPCGLRVQFHRCSTSRFSKSAESRRFRAQTPRDPNWIGARLSLWLDGMRRIVVSMAKHPKGRLVVSRVNRGSASLVRLIGQINETFAGPSFGELPRVLVLDLDGNGFSGPEL